MTDGEDRVMTIVELRKTKPHTYAGWKPVELIGHLVSVRPYYHVPGGRSHLTPARSPYVFEALVLETFGSEMVVVEYREHTTAPWSRRQPFYPRELHRVYGQCICAACMGEGIHELHGA